MYVREKKIRRGEKTYSYWQVVRGARVDGKVRQRVVAHLGPHADRERADMYARTAGILCGVPGCGEAGEVEPEVRWNHKSWTRGVPDLDYPLLWCSAHYDAWKRGERLRSYPIFPEDREKHRRR
jgi:hypothetical protein